MSRTASVTADPRRTPRGATPRLVMVALVPALLAGCATAPPPSPAAPPVAAAWQPDVRRAAAEAVVAAADPLGADAPLLRELIAAAHQASPTLAAAAERIEAARAAAVSAGAALQPLAEASGSALATRAAPGAPVSRSLSVGVQAAWEIDLFGRLAAAQGAAQSRAAAALSAWHDGRVSLAAEVAGAYIGLRGCEAQARQTEADVASREQVDRLTALTAQAGLRAPADAALARASAAQARSQLAQQRLACERQVKALVALTAWPEHTLRQRLQPGQGQLPRIGPVPLPSVPAQLLQQRPDLQEAQARLQAAAADVQSSQLDRLPSLSLTGQIGLGVSRGGGRSTDGSTWSLGPLQIAMPVLDGGIQASRHRATLAAYDSARQQLESRVREAVREVEQALLDLDAGSRRLADARVAAEGYEDLLRATQARQQGGLASLFELEDARRQAVAARSALIELDQQRATAWVSLYRALGGGWTTADAGPAPPVGPAAAARAPGGD